MAMLLGNVSKRLLQPLGLKFFAERRPHLRALLSSSSVAVCTPNRQAELKRSWSFLLRHKSFAAAEAVLQQAIQECNCMEAMYVLGVENLRKLDSQMGLHASSLHSDGINGVKLDIAKVRKVSKGRGSKSDFERFAQKRKRAENDVKSPPKTVPALVVHASSDDRELEKQRKEAASLIRKATEQGHVDATCHLGNIQLSLSLDVNHLASLSAKVQVAREAVALYERASAAGSAEASYNLGILHHDGLVVEPATLLPGGEDFEVAARPAPASHEKLQSQRILSEDLERSLSYFELAASQGERAASLWCGHCHSTGEGGAPGIDAQRALAHLREALGDPAVAPQAHHRLAQLFRVGLQNTSVAQAGGVQADEGLFLAHLGQAVRGGDEDTMYLLADLHLQLHQHQHQHSHPSGEEEASAELLAFLAHDCLHGQPGHNCGGQEGHCGHPMHPQPQPQQHLARAVQLLQTASAGGQAEASLTLGALVYHGLVKEAGEQEEGGDGHKRRAFELYSVAAEQGSMQAWRNLASMHFLGDGVPRNERTAREIMRVIFGAEGGSPRADTQS